MTSFSYILLKLLLHNDVGLKRMSNVQIMAKINSNPLRRENTCKGHCIGKYLSACLAPAFYSSAPKEAGVRLVKDPISIAETDYCTQHNNICRAFDLLTTPTNPP